MARKESITTEKFQIRGRAAFVRLDKPKKFDDGGDPRWECTFLLDPASKEGLDSIKTVLKTAGDLSKQAYGGIIPLALKQIAAQFVPGTPTPDPKTKDDGIEIAF